jgi:hypothetical protein
MGLLGTFVILGLSLLVGYGLAFSLVFLVGRCFGTNAEYQAWPLFLFAFVVGFFTTFLLLVGSAYREVFWLVFYIAGDFIAFFGLAYLIPKLTSLLFRGKYTVVRWLLTGVLFLTCFIGVLFLMGQLVGNRMARKYLEEGHRRPMERVFKAVKGGVYG